MTAAMGVLDGLRHRGPDDGGTARFGEDVVLLHTRLAIQDVDGRSRCPFNLGGITLVYNGELWNADYVKHEIASASRHGSELRYKTTGDTEVVAAALDQWGTPSVPLSLMQGMFAMAWHDETDGYVGLARDRFGEVPVHWTPIGNSYRGLKEDEDVVVADGFAFASELKALRLLAPIERAELLEPGHWVEFERTLNGRWRAHKRRYYEAPFEPVRTSLETAGQMMRDLMADAILERSVSDVPVCTLLSGGIDSTAVAYHLKDHFPNLVAYTAVYNERSQDARMARVAADAIGIELREIRVPLPHKTDLGEVVRRIEMPFKAQVEIGWPCLWLAQAMKEDGFKVCFSGEGSDELWASYGFSYHVLQRTFGGRKVFGTDAGGEFDVEREREWCRYRRDSFVGQHRKNFPRCNKIFMAHGVECRLPFLHTPLVEFALSVPVDVCVVRAPGHGPSKQKAVMYEAWDGLVPDEIVRRHKVAFQEGMGIKDAIATETFGADNPRVFYNRTFKEEYDA